MRIPGRRRPLLLAFWFSCFALFARGSDIVVFHAGWYPSPQLAGVYVALDRGFYRDAGLEVRLVPFAFGLNSPAEMDATPEACALGTIEGYVFLQKRNDGVDLRALAAALHESPAGYMSLTTAGIRRARDFAGRRIGMHRYAELIYAWTLRRAGLAPDDARMRIVQDDVSLLTRNELDVMQGYAIEEFVRLQLLVNDQASFLSFAELGFSSYSEILYTTGAQAHRHAPTLRTFLAATRRGWAEAFAEPDRTVEILAARLGAEADRAHLRRSLSALRPYVEPAGQSPLAPMTRQRWEALQTTAVEIGLIKQAEPVERFLVNW